VAEPLILYLQFSSPAEIYKLHCQKSIKALKDRQPFVQWTNSKKDDFMDVHA